MPGPAEAPHILIVDDQEAIRRFLAATLEARGYRVSSAANGAAGLDLAGSDPPDFTLLDLRLPDQSGLEVLRRLRERQPGARVVILTSYGRSEVAGEALELGALDFISKPVDLERLLAVIHRGLRPREGAAGLQAADLFADLPGLVPGRSPAMLSLYEQVRKVAVGARSTVLIEGESGAGKDVLAQILHQQSPRRDAPFLEINCAALPESLLESELFGHERGAFTDATQKKLGLLELAHSGTLFLDEIGDMPAPIQVKLLRVLEKMAFRRVGGLETIEVDVRIIAATNRDLAAQVARGRFRDDLYFRLGVVRLQVPPLRERPEDLEALARHFLRTFAAEFGKGFTDLDTAALAALRARPWPGNVRQLRNTLERTVLLEEGTILEAQQLHFDADPEGGGAAGSGDPLARSLASALEDPLPDAGVDLDGLARRFEAAMIRKALAAADGNQSRASRLLRLGRDRLRYRLKAHGLVDEGES
ncbi:MAG: sigma-54 dependent transcriptional regulator [Candidatus Krumholzibacteriia bacterium]